MKALPDVWLVGFGDSSLDFELIVWLTDEATNKPGKVHATYCWEIETALAKYGITIPFPQLPSRSATSIWSADRWTMEKARQTSWHALLLVFVVS